MNERNHRRKRQGMVRVEVHVRKQDAALIRGAAKALVDPELAVETRAALRERFAAGNAQGFKTPLAAAPLEGIDLSRDGVISGEISSRELFDRHQHHLGSSKGFPM